MAVFFLPIREQLVGRFRMLRDKVVGGIALAAFFVILFLSVRFLMENEFSWVVKLSFAILAVLITWLAYYGICYLLGTQELRDGVTPTFVRKWLQRGKKNDQDPG
jgi:hypothetical protein